MQNKIEAINQFINENKEDMISLWELFVNTKSRARERDEAIGFCDLLKSILEEDGFKCRKYDVGEMNAPVLVGDFGDVENQKPIIFSGHYDTVSLTGEHPFKLDDSGKVSGLACLDMKGGIVIAIYVMKALKHLGWSDYPIRMIFVGDEEKGHQQANTPEMIIALAKDGICAFNMETSPIDNKICIGRKGGGVATYDIHGVAAHAGNDYLKGRNAVAEAAHKIYQIHTLTDLTKETTVSVTMINGGTVPNSIPPDCHFEVDVRYTRHSEKDRVVNAFKQIAGETHIEGCSTVFEYSEYMAPFETTEEGIALADFIADVSRACELGQLDQIKLGGGSDASYISLAGVPTVCSMGVKGEFNHTDREYAQLDSLFERTLLLTEVVLNIETYVNRKK